MMKTWNALPRLVRFYIRSVLIGYGAAAIFTTLLIVFDVGHLRHLVTHVSGGFLALFLLWFFNGIVFAGAQASVAILLMKGENDRPAGGRPVPAPALTAVPARH